MTLPNPRDTYKAQLLDYDALLLASDEECCYSLSEREVQMLIAFVDYIAWKTRYIATETEIDRLLIAHWSSNLARKLMSGCCPDNDLHRFSDGGVYQSSSDGGITWIDDPEDDPRNDYIGAPILSGSPSTGKRCAAADNVQGLFTQYRDNLIEIVGATPSIIAIIAGISAFIGVLVGVTGVGVGIGVLFLGFAAEIIQIGGTGISGAITFTVLETFRCLVYCRMDNNGELTYAAWQGLLVDIAEEFDGFAELFFYQTVNGMGYIGVSNAGTIGAATADDCDGCDCACATITVPATAMELDSGRTIAVDDVVDITATGTWCFGPAPTYCTDPDGQVFTEPNTFQMPDENIAALVGRIGTGDWFLIGSSLSFTATEAGNLMLGFNDDYFVDNEGSIEVEICVNL